MLEHKFEPCLMMSTDDLTGLPDSTLAHLLENLESVVAANRTAPQWQLPG
jgi:hypothetical protein